jgi:hypothetical protein
MMAKCLRNPLLQRLSVYLGLGLGAVILVITVLILVFGHAILNGYGKGKAQRAFAAAFPGYTLQIGSLDYAVGANCLVAQSVTLSAKNSTVKVARISLTGVRWARFLWGKAALVDVLKKASLDATSLDLELHRSHYGIRCARLRASVPGAELIAEGAELQPLVEDEELFAADTFRTTRFRVVVPECRILGLAYGELLRKESYRARSVYLSRPTLDALVNCDRPADPFVKRPLMVHEALAAIRKPMRVDSLSITDGYLRYCERMAVGTDPGVLTFAAVNMFAEGIANRGETSDTIQLRAQGNLMDAAVLKVAMMFPVASPDFSFHYSGSLSAMDVTCLNAFLDIAERTRIKSGSTQAAAFEIDVIAGQAHGRVRAIYKDLKIAILDKQTGTEKGLDNRIASFSANLFKIRNANAPNASGLMKEGQVNYTRGPKEEFLKFAWFALRSGVLDVISH